MAAKHRCLPLRGDFEAPEGCVLAFKGSLRGKNTSLPAFERRCSSLLSASSMAVSGDFERKMLRCLPVSGDFDPPFGLVDGCERRFRGAGKLKIACERRFQAKNASLPAFERRNENQATAQTQSQGPMWCVGELPSGGSWAMPAFENQEKEVSIEAMRDLSR